MMSVKQGGINWHFWVFGITQARIEPRRSGPLGNTLTVMSIYKCVCVRVRMRVCVRVYVYVCVCVCVKENATEYI